METKVICPKCGAEIEIAKHQKTVKNAVVIGEDSNLGTIILPVKGEAPEKAGMSVEKRINAMKAAGIDTSDYFTVIGKNGQNVLMKWSSGIPVAVTEDDVIADIKKHGTVPERRLFRRWVEAQMFSALTWTNYFGKVKGYTEWLKSHEYNYQWKTLVEELRVQSKLYNNDYENYCKRNRWINKETLISAAKHYMVLLAAEIEGRAVRKCKGRPYKYVGGRMIFCDEIESKVVQPLHAIISAIESDTNPSRLYNLAKSFNTFKPGVSWGSEKCPEWVDAFKGAGAYYTAENLILFGGCVVHNGTGATYDRDESLKILNTKASCYCNGEGWRMFGFMKKLMKDNGIDIQKEREKWAAEKLLRKAAK